MIKEPVQPEVVRPSSTLAAPSKAGSQPPTKKARVDRRRPITVVIAVLIALAGAVLLVHAVSPGAGPHALAASGTLEADETLISAQISARITALPLMEGSKVSAGDVVAKLDDRLLQLQMQEADVGTRRQLELQQDNYVLRAPIGGTISRVPSKIGETAMPGQVLVAIAPTDRLKLTLYVREADLSRVSVGQELTVSADPFLGRSFSGQVTSINSQAEFTPRNVQTQTDRLNLVFGVQALVSNPDGALKPGMPVDASFGSITAG